jgi:hypothetical protein
LDAIVETVAATAMSGDPDPFVLRLLLTRYRATGDERLFDVLGAALARGIDRCAIERDAGERSAWLVTLAAATAISDDEMLAAAIRTLLESLSQMATPSSIDASLSGAAAISDNERLPSIVDNLERTVARAYEPGDGVLLDASDRFAAVDQVEAASALLTAYDITRRLPYSMLAEELMQTVRAHGAGPPNVREASQAAEVLCRLAALHRDESYRAAAVVAPDADYRADAERMIAGCETDSFDSPRVAAMFGLALARWLDLQ